MLAATDFINLIIIIIFIICWRKWHQYHLDQYRFLIVKFYLVAIDLGIFKSIPFFSLRLDFNLLGSCLLQDLLNYYSNLHIIFLIYDILHLLRKITAFFAINLMLSRLKASFLLEEISYE